MKVTTAELLIEPIGYCNLACKYCYTKHTRDVLPRDKIIAFIERYITSVQLPRVRITFIGRGEVTLYPYLAGVINDLTKKYGKAVSFYIQTNGILIHKVIDELERKDNLEVSISLDGFEQTNDENRGKGTHQRIVQNIRYIANLGIPLNVQTILHPGNYRESKKFQEYIHSISPKITMAFFNVLTREEVIKYEEETHILPPVSSYDPSLIEMRRDLATPDYDFIRDGANDQDSYLCLLCDGRVATCCEFQYKIGTIDTDIATLVSKLDLKLCAKCPVRPRCISNREQNQEKYLTQNLVAVNPRCVLNK